MDNLSTLLTQLISSHKLAFSFLLIILLLIFQWALIRVIRQRNILDSESPRRWVNSITNLTTLLIAAGLVVTWLPEIRLFALSITAFAVAIVLATREFIQCLVGSLYLASSRAFSIGDWVCINDNYGEVVTSDWLSTTLLEIDMISNKYEYTGKTLIIPNNLFVSGTVHNLNFIRRYVLHTFSITMEPEKTDFSSLKLKLLNNAKEYCKDFQEVAGRYGNLIEKRLGIQLNNSEPSIKIGTTDLGKNILTISIFCPTHEATNIEQKLTEDFMRIYYERAE